MFCRKFNLYILVKYFAQDEDYFIHPDPQHRLKSISCYNYISKSYIFVPNDEILFARPACCLHLQLLQLPLAPAEHLQRFHLRKYFEVYI